MNSKRKKNACLKHAAIAPPTALLSQPLGASSPTLPAGSDSRGTILGISVSLALLVLAVFGQTLRFEFVNYDDGVQVYAVPQIENGLTLRGISWAFTHGHGGHWIPLNTISHMLDCQIYGLNAGGHHLTNVLLHAASAILLFVVLRRMTAATWPGAFVAAVFAVHPLHVESVAWVSERKDVLSGFFFMLTLWAYAGYVRKAESRKPKAESGGRFLSSGHYWLSLLFFACGLMSKLMVATLPLVLLLLDYWPLNRVAPPAPAEAGSGKSRWGVARPLILEKIPMLAMSLLAGLGVLFTVPEEDMTFRPPHLVFANRPRPVDGPGLFMADGLPGGIERDFSPPAGHNSIGLESDLGDNCAGGHFHGVFPLAAPAPLSFGGLVMVSGHAGPGAGADWQRHGVSV